MQQQKENIYNEKIKIEGMMDGKQDNITVIMNALNKEREVNFDKQQVIEHLQQSLLNHEEESAQLANKLSCLK